MALLSTKTRKIYKVQPECGQEMDKLENEAIATEDKTPWRLDILSCLCREEARWLLRTTKWPHQQLLLENHASRDEERN